MRVKSQESVRTFQYGVLAVIPVFPAASELESENPLEHTEDLLRRGGRSAFYLLKRAALTVKTDRRTVSADGLFFYSVDFPSLSSPVLSIYSVTGAGEMYNATTMRFQVLSKLWS